MLRFDIADPNSKFGAVGIFSKARLLLAVGWAVGPTTVARLAVTPGAPKKSLGRHRFTVPTQTQSGAVRF